MKRQLRHARDLLQAWHVPRRLRRLEGPRLLVLTYHRVLPRQHADWPVEQPGMLVTPDTLGRHLGMVGRFFEFVDLESWIRSCQAGKNLPRLACAITFDDGWRDNYDHAFPVLKAEGVPATIFLVSDLVGTRYAFWPNRLARALARLRMPGELDAWPEGLRVAADAAGVRGALDRGRVPGDASNRAIELAKSMPDDQINRLLDEVEANSGNATRVRDLLDWHEIREMQASGLVRFGSHTRRHTRLLDTLDATSLADEIQGSAEVIEKHMGHRPALFCYPNGDYCDAALSVVTQSYMAAVTTKMGWNHVGTPLNRLKRVAVHEDIASTEAGLRYRLHRSLRA